MKPVNRWPLRIVASIALALAVASLTMTELSGQDQPRRRMRTVVVDGREVVDGEVIVRFKTPRGGFEEARAAQEVDTEEEETIGRRGLRRWRARRLGTRAMLERLRANPDVEFVEPNYVIRVDAAPNDAYFSYLWGLFNNGQNIGGSTGLVGADSKATLAWDSFTGNLNVVVGVIDTGIDYTHPDLAANIWTAPAPFSVTIGSTVINCAAGTRGFNAITNSCDPRDDHYHGTHVAGTIGAVGNNGIGVAGVNWTASMMGLKFLASNGQGSTSNAIKAIDFAIQVKAAFASTNGANIRVLNNSWGGEGYSTALKEAIDRANAADILFVAAAGNNGRNIDSLPLYPAAYTSPNMVTVAATDNRDQLASFSNYGATSTHLGAPGVSILSTMPGNSYSYLNGTSMASPHVSGVASLIAAYCPQTTAQIKQALLSSVDPVAALSGRSTTGGRLNAQAALAVCRRVTNVTLTSSATSPQAPGTTVTWTASPVDGVQPYAYKWMVFNGVAWTMGSWTSSGTFTWVTPASGTYYVGVWVKSAGNAADAAEFPISRRFDVIASATVTSATVQANRVSPQPLGTAIQLSAASVTGGITPLQYKWLLFDGSSWSTIGNWSTAASMTWTPAAANPAYQVRVWVRSAGNAVDAAEATGDLAFPITASARVTNVSVAPNLASPRAYSTPIQFVATPAGGTAPLQYKWMVLSGSWTMQAWSTSNTFNWTPSAPGTYYVGVWVKSAGNAADAAEAPTSIQYVVTTPTPVSGVLLQSALPQPQQVGTTINWTATPTGGTAPLQYQWRLFNGSTWSTVVDWSSANTWSWTPSVARNDYRVMVNVRGSWNTASVEAWSETLFPITAPPVSSLVVTSSVSNYYPGTSATFTATPTGGAAPHQYTWFVFNGTSWSMLELWQSSNQVVLPLAATGNYIVRAWVRSAGNSANAAEAIAMLPVTVVAPPPISAVQITAPSSPQPVGRGLTYAASVVGGLAPLQYRWSISNGGAYSFLGNWTSSPSVSWTPAAAGAHTLRVWVRNAGNTTDAPDASNTSSITITSDRVTALSITADRAAPQTPGTAIVFTANPTGGIGPHQYKWMVWNGATWSMQGWSSSPTFQWTAGGVGSYMIGVWAKSATNPADAAEFPHAIPYTVAASSVPVASLVSLTSNQPAPQFPGTTIGWTASATGGTQPYEFKWHVFDGVSWTAATGWGASNAFAWTPAFANSNYAVRVWVRSAGNAVDAPEASLQSPFAIVPSSPTVVAVALIPDLAAPRPPGTTVTWTATPTGGIGPHQYKWMVYNGAWTMFAWTTSNTFTWTPPASGTYYIGVWVKSAGNPNDAAEKPHAVQYVVSP